jgi:Holliday junction resolvase-like predicted endonuclease
VRGYRIELGEIEAVLNEPRSVKKSIVIVEVRESSSLFGGQARRFLGRLFAIVAHVTD